MDKAHCSHMKDDGTCGCGMAAMTKEEKIKMEDPNACCANGKCAMK